MQSNTLFITNQNQRSEPPEQIVRDIVAGFQDDILDRNASKPWKGGFLQDACRVSPTVREFLFEGQNWYAPNSAACVSLSIALPASCASQHSWLPNFQAPALV